jgi:hypothetical protein
VVAVVSTLNQVRCQLMNWDLRRFGAHQPQVIGEDVFDQGWLLPLLAERRPEKKSAKAQIHCQHIHCINSGNSRFHLHLHCGTKPKR